MYSGRFLFCLGLATTANFALANVPRTRDIQAEQLRDKSMAELKQLGVLDALNLSALNTEALQVKSSWLFPAMHWVEKNRQKLVLAEDGTQAEAKNLEAFDLNGEKFSSNVAFNNVLEQVVEGSFTSDSLIDRGEFEEWWKKTPAKKLYYAKEISSDKERQKTQVEPVQYYRALLIYEQAKSALEVLQNKDAIPTESLARALGDFTRASVSIAMTKRNAERLEAILKTPTLPRRNAEMPAPGHIPQGKILN